MPTRLLSSCTGAAVLAVAALSAASAAAEGQVFEGLVAEQVSLVPAAGAIVILLEEDTTGGWVQVGLTIADAEGAFAIQAPRPGVYRVQAELDGLSSPMSAAAHLDGPDAVRDVALLLPSVLLRDALLCEAPSGREAVAAVVGVVRDEATDVALGGATVTAIWYQSGSERRLETVSDEAGRYRLCVPVDARRLTLDSHLLGRLVQHGDVEVTGPSVIFRDLQVPLSDGASDAVADLVPLEIAGLEVTVRARSLESAQVTPFRRNLVHGARMAVEEERGANAFEVVRRSTPGIRITEWWREGSPPILCIQTNRRIQSLQPRESDTLGRPAGCETAQVVVDGMRISDGPEFLLRTPAFELESIEFVSPVQAQILYGIGGDTSNGVIVVYTRGKGPHASEARERL